MNIESVDGKFVIYRGPEDKKSYFWFFVDADKSSWSRYLYGAARYSTKKAAEESIERLRKRARQRRKGKAA